MAKKTGRMAAELCGAVIGAGFASGQEINSFFARFGVWSWLGVAAASAVIGWMTLGLMRRPGETGMPCAWHGRRQGRAWRGMFVALLGATGGAMLAAGGEVAALLIPAHGARGAGVSAMLVAAWYLARRDTPALAVLSRGLILCLVAIIATGLFRPAEDVVSMRAPGAAGVFSGLCYGGFNMALVAPVITQAATGMTEGERRRCTVCFTMVVALLLACGNAVLLRQATLRESQLPFVMLLSPLGHAGYVLGGFSLGLAALTSLVACMRGLNSLTGGRMLPVAAAMLLLAGGRLEGIVRVVYPALGAGCFLLLGAALMRNQTKM